MNSRSRLLFLLLFCVGYTFAQEHKENTNLINVKQRLLKRKPDEMKEQTDSFQKLHLMIGGNVYQTEKQVSYAYNAETGKYNFKDELKYIQPILNLGDITVINLKTAFGDDPTNIFSAPDEFALSLKYSGINALMHANQYTANVNKQTLIRTRDIFNHYDMFHTGAFADKNERQGNYPLIINKKGFRIAILNYTSLPARPGVSRDFFINEIDKPTLDRDMRLAFAYKPDFIIVYFNWGGDDSQENPNHTQQDLAQYAFEKGANLVIGSAPNRPMRLDYLNYYYKGKPREGIVAYSLGNLVGSNEEIKNRNGYLLDIELKKNTFTTETNMVDFGVIPVYTYYDTLSVKGKTSILSVPCWAVEAGDILQNLPYIEKRRVVNAAYEVRKLLGASADEIQYNMNERVVSNVAETILITNAPLNNKQSQARELDLKPSAAPAFAVSGDKTAQSVALVQEQMTQRAITPVYGDKPGQLDINKQVVELNKKDQIETNIAAKQADALKTSTTAGTTQPTEKNAIADNKVVAANTAQADKTVQQPTNNAVVGNDAATAVNQTTAKQPDKIEAQPGAVNNEKVQVKDNPQNTGTVNPTVGGATTVAGKQPDKNEVQPAAVKTDATNPADKNQNNPVAKNTEVNTGNPAVKTDATANNTQNQKAAQPANPTSTTVAKKDVTDNTVANTKDKTTQPVVAQNQKTAVANDPATQGNRQTNPVQQNDAKYRTGNDNPQAKNPATGNATKPENAGTQAGSRTAQESAGLDSKTPLQLNNTVTAEKIDVAPVTGKGLKLETDTTFRVQFYALKTLIPIDTNYYVHLKGFEVVEEDGLYKYMIGKFKNYNDCYQYWTTQILPRYKQSYIVKYIAGKRVLK